MAVSRSKKAETLELLAQSFAAAQGVGFMANLGLSVAEVSTLRKEMKAAGVKLVVAKKTLIRKASQQANISLDSLPLDGAVAVAFADEDALAAFKTIHAFSKKDKVSKAQLVGGIFEKQVLSQQEAVTYASLPSRQELLGRFAGGLSGIIRNFAVVLDQVAKQKAE